LALGECAHVVDGKVVDILWLPGCEPKKFEAGEVVRHKPSGRIAIVELMNTDRRYVWVRSLGVKNSVSSECWCVDDAELYAPPVEKVWMAIGRADGRGQCAETRKIAETLCAEFIIVEKPEARK